MKWLLFFLISVPAWADPAQVIIIRHAEKQDSNLSPQGQERARLLVNYFLKTPELNEYGRPAAIFAFRPKPNGHSARAVETVTPLAEALNMKIDTDFKRDETQALVREIFDNPAYDGKMVLICWEHHRIAAIEQDLGVSDPQPWSGDVFDRTLVIDFDKSGHITRFRNLPQHLLPGDSDH